MQLSSLPNGASLNKRKQRPRKRKVRRRLETWAAQEHDQLKALQLTFDTCWLTELLWEDKLSRAISKVSIIIPRVSFLVQGSQMKAITYSTWCWSSWLSVHNKEKCWWHLSELSLVFSNFSSMLLVSSSTTSTRIDVPRNLTKSGHRWSTNSFKDLNLKSTYPKVRF
jgi:hypothetical protein